MISQSVGLRLRATLLLLAAAGVILHFSSQVSTTEATCSPHYFLSKDTYETTSPANGGYAKTEVMLRGFHYYYPDWVDLWCFHSEAKSWTQYSIDYIYASGETYTGFASGPHFLEDEGTDYCSNCTTAEWKSRAVWTDAGAGLWGWGYGYHYFDDGVSSWVSSPSPLDTAHNLPDY